MVIAYTLLSVSWCGIAGYMGFALAEYIEISEWWLVTPAIILAIAVLSFVETFKWHYRYYTGPRKRLKRWSETNKPKP